jgi:uroporphyrinogen-III decarboxylase
MANALIAVRELCDYDGIYVSRDNLVLHQALGGEVVFPFDDEPFCRQVLVGSVEEYRKLSIPSPQKALGMKTVLEAAKIVQKRAGEDYYIQANIDSGPFEMAAKGYLLDSTALGQGSR